MFRAIRAKYGRLDIAINNAAVNPALALSLLTSTQAVAQTAMTNVLGTFAVSREAARLMMRGKWGRIINFSSMAVRHELPGEATYSASKAAVHALTRVMAKELFRYGITCNVIAPSAIETDMMAAVPRGALQEVYPATPFRDGQGRRREQRDRLADPARDPGGHRPGHLPRGRLSADDRHCHLRLLAGKLLHPPRRPGCGRHRPGRGHQRHCRCSRNACASCASDSWYPRALRSRRLGRQVEGTRRGIVPPTRRRPQAFLRQANFYRKLFGRSRAISIPKVDVDLCRLLTGAFRMHRPGGHLHAWPHGGQRVLPDGGEPVWRGHHLRQTSAERTCPAATRSRLRPASGVSRVYRRR